MKTISSHIFIITKKIVILETDPNSMGTMLKMVKIFKVLFLALFLALVSGTGCATAKQNPYAKKRKSSSHVSTTQLGRNRYYFSTDYQKKLTKNYKNK
jgi:hypothetical protein